MKALNRKEVLVNAKANGTLDSFKPLTREEAFTKKALELGGGDVAWEDIKNRPFGEEVGEVVIFQGENVTFTEAEGNYLTQSPRDNASTIAIGDTVDVIWDGVEYLGLVAYDDNGYVTIGASYGATNETMPFNIFMDRSGFDDVWVARTHSNTTTHSFSVIAVKETIKTLDPKYLPKVASSVFDKLVDSQLIKSLSLNEADTDDLEWDTLSSPSAIMGYNCELSNFYAAFAGEEKLLIVFDGVAYIAKRTLEPVGSTVFYIGNTKFFGGPDTGEPFCIACNWYFQPHAHIVMSSYKPFSIDVYRIRDDLKKEAGFTENLIRVIRADYPGQESTDIHLTKALNIVKPHIIEVRGDQLIIDKPTTQGNAYVWGSVETDGFALYNNVHYPDYQIDPNGYSWGGVYMRFDLEKYPDIDPVNDVLIYELDYDVVFLTSPNGTTYKLTVSDDGTLSATAV